MTHNCYSFWLGWIPRNFKTFTFSPNCHFWGKITRMITRVDSRIFTYSPYTWFFCIFHENSHYPNGHLQENSENHIYIYVGLIRKNPGINPRYPFCDFPSKKTIWGKTESFEISRNWTLTLFITVNNSLWLERRLTVNLTIYNILQKILYKVHQFNTRLNKIRLYYSVYPKDNLKIGCRTIPQQSGRI